MLEGKKKGDIYIGIVRILYIDQDCEMCTRMLEGRKLEGYI
jgi:hypothetical protein